jgi:hypothetical protein
MGCRALARRSINKRKSHAANTPAHRRWDRACAGRRSRQNGKDRREGKRTRTASNPRWLRAGPMKQPSGVGEAFFAPDHGEEPCQLLGLLAKRRHRSSLSPRQASTDSPTFPSPDD